MAVDSVVQAILFGIVIYVIFQLISYFYTITQLPPGPSWFTTIFSNALDITQPFGTLTKWRKKYGDIICMCQFKKNIIVVSSEELIREVLVNRADDFSGRPLMLRAKLITNFKETISFGSDNPRWRIKKKALMTAIKMYGEGLETLERIALKSVAVMVEKFHESQGKPFDPDAPVRYATGDIITSLVYGSAVSPEDVDTFKYLDGGLARLNTSGGIGQELEWFPWLRFIKRSLTEKYKVLQRAEYKIYGRLLQDRKKQVDVNSPECALDALFSYQAKGYKDINHEADLGCFDDGSIQMLTRDLIAAGMVTTTSSMSALILILCEYKNVQKMLQEEVDTFVGGEETPRLHHRSKMHYTEATILELLRYISNAPLLLPHNSMKDTTLGGYNIPKNTEVWVNVWSYHRDERYWEEPLTFNPERFLNSDGSIVGPNHLSKKRLMAFSAGRRNCPGEILARNRLFLFIACLMQKFTFSLPDSVPKDHYLPENYVTGLVLRPYPYEIIATPR